MFTYPGSAVLGASKTGLAIGYRLVNLDGTQNAAFTTTNVVETSVPGNYTVTGGISLPDGFSGRIEWGTSGTKYAEAWVGPNDFENSDAKTSSRSSHSAADVWAVGTRTLTSFGTLVTDAVTAVWAAASRTLTAFGFTVNTNANATELSIKAQTDLIPAFPAAVGSAMTLTVGERDAIAAAHEAFEVEAANSPAPAFTVLDVQRQMLGMSAGVTTGMGTTEGTVKNPKGDKNRVVADIDADGNREPTAWDNT